MEDLNHSIAYDDSDALFSSFFNPDMADPVLASSMDTTSYLLAPRGTQDDEFTSSDCEPRSSPSSPITEYSPSYLPMTSLTSPSAELNFPALFDLKIEPTPAESAFEFGEMKKEVARRKSPTLEDSMVTETCANKRQTKKRQSPSTPTTTKKRAPRSVKKQKVEGDFISSLKGLPSTELERIANEQPLSSFQQEELKKFTRMIKNRESAQLSRERRKVYQGHMEERFDRETIRNAQLKQQILELEAESKILKSEFLHFKSLIDRSNLGQAFASFQENNAFQATTNSAAAGDMRAQTTFAMYLMVALQSIGQQLYTLGSLPAASASLTPVEVKA